MTTGLNQLKPARARPAPDAGRARAAPTPEGDNSPPSDMDHLNDLLRYLAAPLLSLTPLKAFHVFNLIVSAFCAVMMFSVKSETINEERPWTTYLGLAFAIFALQYIASSAGIPVLITGTWPEGSSGFVWSELFGIPINWFLMSSAWTLLNRRFLPTWFFVLLAIDLAAVALGIFYIRIDDSAGLPATLCRMAGDAITFTSLMFFGYAAYTSSKFYRNRMGMVWGIAIGLFYGVIHLISPFRPNLALAYASNPSDAADVEAHITAVLVFLAAVSKLALLYTAFRIIAQEDQTLIMLRNRLRESVVKRKVFFSREGILDAIIEAFEAGRVKLYIKVPPMRQLADERSVHVYSGPSASPSEYERKPESETPLPEAMAKARAELEEAERLRAAKDGCTPLRDRIARAVGARAGRAPFDGLEPILYHGALIGCLWIEKFTYSAEQLCRILSQDISVVVQFYRLQESLPVLLEGLNKNLGTPSTSEGAPSSAALGQSFEDAIHQVLSPVKTRLFIEAGFVGTDGAADAAAQVEGCKPRTYNCITDEASGRLHVGRLRLDFLEASDPIDLPSLGYFRAYGDAMASIVASTFVSCVDQNFGLILRRLSFELTRPQTLESWFGEVQRGVKEAELDGFVLYHPGLLGSRQLARANEAADNRAVAEVLAGALPEPGDFLRPLKDSRPKVVPAAAGRLVLGMKLPHSEAGLFVGVRRARFAEELAANSPWCNFLTNLAGIAGNSIERILYTLQLQKRQMERAEDYMVIETAEKVNFITHELINRVVTLNSNAALLKHGLKGLGLDDPSSKALEGRVEEVRREFGGLRDLLERLHCAAPMPEESGPCSLEKTLRKVIGLYGMGRNIEIEYEGIRARPGRAPLPPGPADVSINLPALIVELTFSNLIRNSIAAIKRGANGVEGAGTRSLIRIWAEVEDGKKFVECFVNDTGAGVSPSVRDSIFNLSVSATPGRGGWGLFYLRRMLERDGGSIRLQHSEPGDTTFSVRLPKLST